MKVAELMQTNLKTISTDASVAEAVDLFAVSGLSAVPVLDRLGRAVGVITTRQIDPDLDVRQAAQEMLYLNVQRLFVEFDGALVGVISQTDIVGAVATAKV